MSIARNKTAEAVFIDTMNMLNARYVRLLDLGIPAEDARYVLPNACTSEIDVSMNMREFMNFCHERLCSRAQWEIRSMARLMVALVNAEAPGLKYLFVPKCEAHAPYNFCPEENSCGIHPKLEAVFRDYNYNASLRDFETPTHN
jgi:thymidylate synthase (FAD)